jgi:hypothetical protein
VGAAEVPGQQAAQFHRIEATGTRPDVPHELRDPDVRQGPRRLQAIEQLGQRPPSGDADDHPRLKTPGDDRGRHVRDRGPRAQHASAEVPGDHREAETEARPEGLLELRVPGVVILDRDADDASTPRLGPWCCNTSRRPIIAERKRRALTRRTRQDPSGSSARGCRRRR